MRIVLDTNVLVSGIFFKGTPFQILSAWFDGRFEAYATRPILEEYLRVIEDLSATRRPVFHHEWNSILPEICHLVPEKTLPGKFSRDPADDKFIFCAINAAADCLVTGDQDLKTLILPYRFRIVSPRQFIHILSKG